MLSIAFTAASRSSNVPATIAESRSSASVACAVPPATASVRRTVRPSMATLDAPDADIPIRTLRNKLKLYGGQAAPMAMPREGQRAIA